MGRNVIHRRTSSDSTPTTSTTCGLSEQQPNVGTPLEGLEAGSKMSTHQLSNPTGNLCQERGLPESHVTSHGTSRRRKVDRPRTENSQQTSCQNSGLLRDVQHPSYRYPMDYRAPRASAASHICHAPGSNTHALPITASAARETNNRHINPPDAYIKHQQQPRQSAISASRAFSGVCPFCRAFDWRSG